MLGAQQQKSSFGRKRAARWLAVLAFGLAQLLLGLHSHALDAAQAPESVCSACVYSAGELLPGPSPAAPFRKKPLQTAYATIPVAACVKRRLSPIWQRAPPSS